MPAFLSSFCQFMCQLVNSVCLTIDFRLTGVRIREAVKDLSPTGYISLIDSIPCGNWRGVGGGGVKQGLTMRAVERVLS